MSFNDVLFNEILGEIDEIECFMVGINGELKGDDMGLLITSEETTSEINERRVIEMTYYVALRDDIDFYIHTILNDKFKMKKIIEHPYLLHTYIQSYDDVIYTKDLIFLNESSYKCTLANNRVSYNNYLKCKVHNMHNKIKPHIRPTLKLSLDDFVNEIADDRYDNKFTENIKLLAYTFKNIQIKATLTTDEIICFIITKKLLFIFDIPQDKFSEQFNVYKITLKPMGETIKNLKPEGLPRLNRIQEIYYRLENNLLTFED